MVIKQWPYEAAARAFEAIPRTLSQNCGVNVIRTMTVLQGKVIIFLHKKIYGVDKYILKHIPVLICWS